MKHNPASIAKLVPRDTRYEEPVEKSHPLWVQVEPNGNKFYVCRARINGKSQRKRIGKVAEWTLTYAKVRANAMNDDAEAGGGETWKTAKTVVDALPVGAKCTVGAAWSYYMEAEGAQKASGDSKASFYRRFVEPVWGERLISTIDRDDCALLIDKHLTDHKAADPNYRGVATNHLVSHLSRFFRWSCREGYAKTRLKSSPMAEVVKPTNEKQLRKKVRPLSEQELDWFFKALAAHASGEGAKRGSEPQREIAARAVEQLLRSVCRRDNIFAATWGQVTEAGLFLPKTKNGTPLMVPLTDSMKVLMGKRPADALDTDAIFAGCTTWLARSLDDIRERMTAIAAKVGFNGDFAAKLIGGKPNPHRFVLHDFRSTATMWFKNQRHDDGMPKYPGEVRKAMLNHREASVEGLHYNDDAEDPYYMFAERKVLGVAWSDYLDTVKAKALAMALAA